MKFPFLKKLLRPEVLGPVLGHVYVALCATYRYRVTGVDHLIPRFAAGERFVVACWHNELFSFAYYGTRVHQLRPCAVVSQSKDGEFLARTLNGVGVQTARGSSNRGGLRAIAEARKMMRSGDRQGCVFTVDGPKGPRHEVKPGVIYLAHKLGLPIFPMRAMARRPYVFQKAWDRFEIPLPFTTVDLAFGEPYTLHAPSDAKLDEGQLQAEQERLASKLHRLGTPYEEPGGQR